LSPQRDNTVSPPAQHLCRTPHLTPGNYKKLNTSDISSAPSDLTALVCLALWCACLKQHSADTVTQSVNKQKVFLTVRPCYQPGWCVSGCLGFFCFSVSSCIQPDSAGFCVGVSPHSLQRVCRACFPTQGINSVTLRLLRRSVCLSSQHLLGWKWLTISFTSSTGRIHFTPCLLLRDLCI